MAKASKKELNCKNESHAVVKKVSSAKHKSQSTGDKDNSKAGGAVLSILKVGTCIQLKTRII